MSLDVPTINEFTYEIMVKLIRIQLQICFSEEKCFEHPK